MLLVFLLLLFCYCCCRCFVVVASAYRFVYRFLSLCCVEFCDATIHATICCGSLRFLIRFVTFVCPLFNPVVRAFFVTQLLLHAKPDFPTCGGALSKLTCSYLLCAELGTSVYNCLWQGRGKRQLTTKRFSATLKNLKPQCRDVLPCAQQSLKKETARTCRSNQAFSTSPGQWQIEVSKPRPTPKHVLNIWPQTRLIPLVFCC